jgi:acetyl esterase/lipase
MAYLSFRSSAAVFLFALIANITHAADTTSGWQPAAGNTQISLWPKGPPETHAVLGAEAVFYAVDMQTKKKKLAGGEPYQYIENVMQPTITVYSPTQNNSGAAVIVYPGGGFNVLAIDIEGTEACDWLNLNGITCVLLKYRVPCKHIGAYRECPQAHQDAQRAMRIVRSHANKWRINPNKIGVLGFSAGAHMAIVSSTRFDRMYVAVDDADKLSSRPDFALVFYPGRMARRELKFVPNPDIKVSDKTSPTFLVHAYDDEMNPVENSLVYAAALRNAKVPAEIHIYAKGGHAFGLRRTGLPSAQWPELALAWMKGIGVINK